MAFDGKKNVRINPHGEAWRQDKSFYCQVDREPQLINTSSSGEVRESESESE